jgi:hypothetical protein
MGRKPFSWIEVAHVSGRHSKPWRRGCCHSGAGSRKLNVGTTACSSAISPLAGCRWAWMPSSVGLTGWPRRRTRLPEHSITRLLWPPDGQAPRGGTVESRGYCSLLYSCASARPRVLVSMSGQQETPLVSRYPRRSDRRGLRTVNQPRRLDTRSSTGRAIGSLTCSRVSVAYQHHVTPRPRRSLRSGWQPFIRPGRARPGPSLGPGADHSPSAGRSRRTDVSIAAPCLRPIDNHQVDAGFAGHASPSRAFHAGMTLCPRDASRR